MGPSGSLWDFGVKMVFFWACEVTETKAAVVKIPQDYVLNVCSATLADSDNAGIVSVGIETTQMDSKVWKGVVAHLGATAHAHQVKLDLVFGVTPQIKFYVAKGTGKVNLTGYFQPGPSAELVEAVPVQEAKPVQTADKKSKKRAREETTSVAWDQAASSDSEDEAEKEEQPTKKQTTASKPQAAKPSPVNGHADTAAAANGAKKKKKKNRNKNKDKKE
ncbi:hypothetical protein Poli38472_003803 [Pythium oligandrum]|uniref:Nucleoplasmin-like domain-containing protein n=1 Tax=Pythium oligandrum TaxID=41045 RepID=A0A8K1CPI9_PYTOL|nr:hypothetical protein Poli38472_003803 [Pythium oligandrum]|eukprot:TMW66038.1 hypothetical protein Poli38472_003803 [Pythium oligandrum]